MSPGAVLEFSARLAASRGLAKTSEGSQSASFKFASGFMGASKLPWPAWQFVGKAAHCSLVGEMILTQCAVCATELGLTLGKKCGRCSTRYCGPECQVQHWKEGGHDTLCKKIKKAGGAEQYNANTVSYTHLTLPTILLV